MLTTAFPGVPNSVNHVLLAPCEVPHNTRCYNRPVPAPASSTHRELVASPDDSGLRLDRFVVAQCPELSRTRIQELIEAELVLVDGRAAKGSQRLRGGERITVEAQPRP